MEMGDNSVNTSIFDEDTEGNKDKLPLFPNLDFETYLCQGRPDIGIMHDIPKYLKDDLVAASIAYQLGLKSIDYTKKRYLEHLPEQKIEKRIDHEIAKYVALWQDQIARLFKKLSDETSDGDGHPIAGVILIRLMATVMCVHTLAQRGFLVEPLSLIRSGLEQISWAIQARHEDTLERAMGSSGERWITHLNRLYPTAGRFYGYLSEMAHFHPKRHLLFYDMSTGHVGALHASHIFKPTGLICLLLFMEIYSHVFFQLYRKEIFLPWLHTRLGKIRRSRSTLNLARKLLNFKHGRPLAVEAFSFFA